MKATWTCTPHDTYELETDTNLAFYNRSQEASQI